MPKEKEYEAEIDESSFYGKDNDSSFNEILEELDGESLVEALKGEASIADVYNGNFTNTEAEYDPYVNFSEEGRKANILGLPPNFNKTADPNGRVYKNTIMQDLPYVFMIPGKPTLNSKLIDVNGKKIKKGKLEEQLNSIEDSRFFAVKGARTGYDLRFMGFKADYSEYYKYVQVMLSTVHATMGIGGLFNFKDEFKPSVTDYGLCFYADKSTSISESASNDYGESSLVQQANDASSAAREIRTILGVDNPKIKDYESSSITSMLNSIMDSTGILSRVFGGIGRVINGSQLLYPEIWADSKFDRTYTINFKFYSPYGDKESIFKYVYVPFLSLLALALPRQDSILGYAQPFIMKMSCPGWFESSLCVVQSIQFEKGGNDNLWTIDNLPQEINVNVTIRDLYSTLPINKTYNKLAYNLGLASFLDNMAGIRTDQLDFVLRSSAFVKTRLTVPSRIFNGGIFSDFAYEIQSKFNDIIK